MGGLVAGQAVTALGHMAVAQPPVGQERALVTELEPEIPENPYPSWDNAAGSRGKKSKWTKSTADIYNINPTGCLLS